MRKDVQYEVTHTFIMRKAVIFDQYGLIIFHQQVKQSRKERAINAREGTKGKAKENGTMG